MYLLEVVVSLRGSVCMVLGPGVAVMEAVLPAAALISKSGGGLAPHATYTHEVCAAEVSSVSPPPAQSSPAPAAARAERSACVPLSLSSPKTKHHQQ